MTSHKLNVRHERILAALAGGLEATVESLAARLGVSIMTIRRDLARLAEEGRVVRTHGGAVLTRSGVIEFAVGARGLRQLAQKRAIARAVAARLRPGMAVSLDTGTTMIEVARALAGIQGLTVLTSSLAVASALYGREGLQLVLLGGSVRQQSPDLTGPLTEENLRRFRAHLAVIGADAVTSRGVFTTEVGIARVSQAMAENAARTLLAADSSKFQATAFVQCLDLGRVHEVVTDDACPREVRAWLEAAVEWVEYAPVPEGEAAEAGTVLEESQHA